MLLRSQCCICIKHDNKIYKEEEEENEGTKKYRKVAFFLYEQLFY